MEERERETNKVPKVQSSKQIISVLISYIISIIIIAVDAVGVRFVVVIIRVGPIALHM